MVWNRSGPGKPHFCDLKMTPNIIKDVNMKTIHTIAVYLTAHAAGTLLPDLIYLLGAFSVYSI